MLNPKNPGAFHDVERADQVGFDIGPRIFQRIAHPRLRREVDDDVGPFPQGKRLKPGHVDVLLADGERQQFYVSGGILEVQPQVVTVLADTAARAADLDEAAALRARKEAEEALANRTEAMEIAEAQAKLAQAMAQLQALERLRKNLKH